MSWESCTVILNNDSTGSVYAGDIVTGSVTLEFAKKKKIENIYFQIHGYCEAQWSRPRPTMPFIKIYSEKRVLLHIEMDVFGDSFERIINPGKYNFPFHFALPEDLPSTFESSIAKVQYYIKIEMKGMCKPKKTIPFVVLGNVNLNSIEEFLDPSTYILEKACWNSKFISMTLKTYVGFASKQTVPIQMKIENEKKAKISKIKTHLIQKLRYCIFEGHAEEERSMCNVEYNKLLNTVYETCNFSMDNWTYQMLHHLPYTQPML